MFEDDGIWNGIIVFCYFAAFIILIFGAYVVVHFLAKVW